MSPLREGLLLGGLCLTLYLTGTGEVAFYTRGEPREGLVAREMLATGKWLVPSRPAGELARKPPLYYWLAAPTLATFPETPERALRLPSAVLATTAVLGTWATARAVFGAAAALPAGLVLATSFEWTRAATSARVDMTLAAALTAAVAGWTLVLAGRRTRLGDALSVGGVALGVLAKGPVALVLPALAAGVLAVWRRDADVLARLRPVHVLAIAGVVGGLWYAAAFAREGPAMMGVVARENWLRFLDAEDHEHGVGYLIPLSLVGMIPWSLLLPLVVGPVRERGLPAAWLVAWSVTALVFFSVAQAKRSVYLLPIYPAVALLIGAGATLLPPGGRGARVLVWATHLYAIAFALVALLAGALAMGVDVSAIVRPWLRPADAAGAAGVVDAVRAAAPIFFLLALAIVVALPVLLAAGRRRDWARVVVVVALLMAAGITAFDAYVHPVVARTRSLRDFFVRVDGLVGPGESLYARFPPDPGLRFYVPRPLLPWTRADGLDAPGRVLLWEDDWRRLRTPAGDPLRVVAVSDGRQPSRGHLALVDVPAGPLAVVSVPPESAGPDDPGLTPSPKARDSRGR